MAMNNIVSKAEIELLSIACRVDTALRYRDENGADDNWIRQGIEDEMMPSVTEWWLPGEPTIEDEENAEDAAAEAAAEEEDGDGDSDDEVQIPRRSERNAKGKAPARADVDASDGSGDVEMGEARQPEDSEEVSASQACDRRLTNIRGPCEATAAQAQYPAKAAKAAGRLLNSNYNVEECKPQADAPKSCRAILRRRGVALKKALKEAAKVKLEAKNRKRSTTSIMEELPVTLEGLQERLDSMEAEAIAFQDTSEANTKAFREAMESRMDALQDTLYNIDIMMRAVCMRNSITPSTLALRIPPVPLFVPAAPSPSPTAGPSSIASTFSSMSSAAGFDISQLSIAAPLARVASGSGAGNTLTPVPLSRTPSLNRGRGGASRPPSQPRALQDPRLRALLDPKPRVLLGLGHRLARATEGIGPS
ncbi:hypothetical protein EDB84DRAFT_1447217 [Lactarius hengduanensis]|nr:hypothetical protein EDB84DRAFT_1447217 [Lactarius hengduanensis]